MSAFISGVALRSGSLHKQHGVRCCEYPTAPPGSLPDAVRLAGESLRAANLPHRAQAHFLIPGLNTNLEDTYPYSDSLMSDTALLLGEAAANVYADEDQQLPNIVLLFKSAGTAAAAQAYFTRSNKFQDVVSSGRLFIKSFALRDSPLQESTLLPDNSVAIVVNPATSRGDKVVDEVRAVIHREIGRAFILLNPDFSADVSALGIVERGQRDEFLASFVPVFYLRTLAYIKRPALVATEEGALLRVFPDPYTVWRIASSGGYEAKKSFAALPSRTEITDALDAAPREKTYSKQSPAIPDGEVALLRTILALSVLASGTFYALRMFAPSLMVPN